MKRFLSWLLPALACVVVVSFWVTRLVTPVAAQGGADLYIKDTPLDSGTEPNPDSGPMWVSEDIWVRTQPDPGYLPQPFPESSPTWTPLPHENPEYRDPKYSSLD